MTVKNSMLRDAVPAVLKSLDYRVVSQSSRGVLPGARLVATKEGKTFRVAVKVLLERRMNFTRLSATKWRTLSDVDVVIAVAPVGDGSDAYEIIAFAAKPLIACFDQAWKTLKKANRALAFGVPVFIPLDEGSKKNVGHDVANLMELKDWAVARSLSEMRALSSVTAPDTFIDRVKREFAERNEVDVSKVVVEFRIIT